MTTLTGPALIAELERTFDTVNDDVRIGPHTVNVLRPRSADELINERDYARDERLPYWAELWPSSTVLANFLMEHPIAPTHAIELGSGIGLVAIAAALAGHKVLATDYYEDALDFTRANALRNLGYELDTLLLDWRAVPASLPRSELVLASDVLYETRYAPMVAGMIDRALAFHGTAFVADPGRIATEAFVDACRERGLAVETRTTRPYLAGKVRQTISVFAISR